MNGMNAVCNSNSMSKNLPLKKRRIYQIETNDENQTKFFKTKSPDQTYPMHVPTPPSSPHIEFLRQQYAYLSNYPSNQNYQLSQQYFAHYRTKIDQQHHGYRSAGEDFFLDEYFRKSIMNNHSKYSVRCLTPDDSSSSSSPSFERNSAESIDEHFARSLAKFGPPANDEEKSTIYRRITESVVDDHFARALGAKTWEKLKEKC